MRHVNLIVLGVLGLSWLSGCDTLRGPTAVDRAAAPSPAIIAPAPPHTSVAMTSPAASGTHANPLPTVYFTSMVGCEACDLVRPTVRQVARQYADVVTLVTIDMSTERGEHQAAALGVRGYPVLVLHDRHGDEVIRMFGVPNQERIQQGFALLATTP